ncbi:MAG: TIGR04282 family arsenosugar biosynthesis glycosyltransferase [Pseudomonadota bacterium]
MAFQFSDALVLVFAKAPVAGQVKTRLVPQLGADAAAALHARLVERTLQTVCSAKLAETELWCAPDCSHDFFQNAAEKYRASLHAQSGEDLGLRMHHAFVDALQRKSRAVLIGTDCPVLDYSYLRQALAALDGPCDLVLGPAEDGGYVLIGLRRPVAGLFDSVPWGTHAVLAETLERAHALGLKSHLLPVLWDVDRPADVARMLQLP